MSEVTCTRAQKDGSSVKMMIKARQHSLSADAERADGGTDEAPNPHELLAASLASCTSITVQMYANRKAWPLQSADVTVRISKTKEPAATADGSVGSAQVNFDVTVSFQGALSIEQRERLLEIANKCPVHKILVGTIAIKLVSV